MNKTFLPTVESIRRKWYVIDCKDKQLGRLASVLTKILSGKGKSYYYPGFDLGDCIILINADLMIIDRYIKQLYVFKPGRPGSSLKTIVKCLPQQIIRRCIYRMMPNGIGKKCLSKRLKIYQGSDHPHLAQKPIYLKDINNFTDHI